jgi:hypothetical protein
MIRASCALQPHGSGSVPPEQAPIPDVPPGHDDALVPGLGHDGALRVAPRGRSNHSANSFSGLSGKPSHESHFAEPSPTLRIILIMR